MECLYRQKWSSIDGLGALIISPTRELAYQTFEVLKKIGKLHDFSAGLVIGGKVCDMSKIVFKSDILHKENSKTHLYGTQKSRKLLLQGSFFFRIPLFEHCYVPFIRSKFHWFFFFMMISWQLLKEETARINRTNIIICTPGRLLQHMDETFNFTADSLQILGKVAIFKSL